MSALTLEALEAKVKDLFANFNFSELKQLVSTHLEAVNKSMEASHPDLLRSRYIQAMYVHNFDYAYDKNKLLRDLDDLKSKQEAILGKNHLHTLQTRKLYIITSYDELDGTERNESAIESALDNLAEIVIEEVKLAGVNDLETRRSFEKIQSILEFFAEQYPEAALKQTQALYTKFETSLGKDHAVLVPISQLLANLYVQANQYAEAEKHIRLVLTKGVEDGLIEKDTEEYFDLRAQVVHGLIHQNNIPAAMSELQLFIDDLAESDNGDRETIAFYLLNVAELLDKKELYLELEQLLKPALPKYFTIDDEMFLGIRANGLLAKAYAKHGRYGEADPLFQAAITHAHDLDIKLTCEIRELYIESLIAQGKNDAAAAQQKVLEEERAEANRSDYDPFAHISRLLGNFGG